MDISDLCIIVWLKSAAKVMEICDLAKPVANSAAKLAHNCAVYSRTFKNLVLNNIEKVAALFI